LVDGSKHDAGDYLITNSLLMDSPSHTAISLTATISEPIRSEGRELAISGINGDLLFGGSPGYLADLARDRRFFLIMRDLVCHEPDPRQSRYTFIRDRALLPIWRRISTPFVSPKPPAIPFWLHPDRHDCFRDKAEQRNENLDVEAGYRHRTLIVDWIRRFQSMATQDGAEQLLAADGIDSGSPFLDLDILDFAMRLQPRAFSNGRRYKHLLRQVVYDDLGTDIRDWRIPSPWFYLEPREVDSIRRIIPPSNWLLSEFSIVDEPALRRMFRSSKSDALTSADLGRLAVAEVVLRGLTCQQFRFV
jgi:hypothetical protein